MDVSDSARNMAEEIWADEEGVNHTAASVETDKSQLIGESNALCDMIGKW
jgi:hypothetical protein